MSKDLILIPYSDAHQEAFKRLNQAWIDRYFTMEEMDHRALDHPRETIIDQGGYIGLALLGDEVVGVCALVPCPLEGYELELAKMGVVENLRGKGIGRALGQHMIQRAREMGAKKVFLESNRVLKPALSLYHSLGFVEVFGHPSPYRRSNIQMELLLSKK